MGHLGVMRGKTQGHLISLENPHIKRATGFSRQLPIVQKMLGIFPACDFHCSKVFDRCMT